MATSSTQSSPPAASPARADEADVEGHAHVVDDDGDSLFEEPQTSWFSPMQATTALERVRGARKRSLASDVQDERIARASAALQDENEPVFECSRTKLADASRAKRAMITAYAKRLTTALAHLEAERDALVDAPGGLAAWRAGSATVDHVLQLACERFYARYDEIFARETDEAVAAEFPDSCAAECAGPADVGRSLRHENDAPRAVLELVDYDWEESMMRPPRGGEEACVNKNECQGFVLVRDGFARAPNDGGPPTQGVALVRFRTPEQESGTRPCFRGDLCVLCIRNRVTWTWLRNMDSGAPADACITPYRVVAGPGGYAPDALLPVGGPGRFAGVTDPFPRHHYSRYRLVRDPDTKELRYTQDHDVTRFSPTPHAVLAPFEAYGGAGWTIIRTEQEANEVEELLEAWTKAWPSTASLVKEATQRRFALAAFKEAWFDVRIQPVPELWRAVIFGWNGIRTPYRTRRHVEAAALTRAMASAMPFPGPTTGRGTSHQKVLECVRIVPQFFAGAIRSVFPASHAQAAFARIFALSVEGPDAAAITFVMNHPALAMLGLRVHLVRLIQQDGVLRKLLLEIHGVAWTNFEYCVDRGMTRACVAFNRERSLEAAERAAVSAHSREAGGPPPVIQPSDGWFWDAVARETKTTFETHARALAPEETLQAKPFDARAAYDGVRAACRMRGCAPETLRTLLELERAHVARDRRKMKAVLRATPPSVREEITDVATAVHDSFGVRVIRAPHHWAVHGSRAKRRTYVLCPCCRRFKSHVGMSAEEWQRSKRGKTEEQAVAYLCDKVVDEGTIKVAYDPITRSFTCNPKQKSGKLREAAEDMRAAAEVEVDDVNPAAAGAETTTKKKRTIKVQRTVVRYHSCQRTELVPVDFRGNIVEIYGRQYAQCWRCHIPREMDASTHGQTAFLCGWCEDTPPRLRNAPTKWSAVSLLQTKHARGSLLGAAAWRRAGESGVKRLNVECDCGAKLTKTPIRPWRTVRCIGHPEQKCFTTCVDVPICTKHRPPRWMHNTSVVVWEYFDKVVRG